MDDSEVDDFFEGLAGNRGKEQPTNASHRLGATLRAETLRHESDTETLSADEELKREALLNSLEERGLFREPTQSNVTPLRSAHPTKTPFARWGRPVALAAMLALCAVGVLQLLPTSPVPPGVERGSAELTVRSDDPAATVRAMTRELTQAGAEVQAVQINDSTWTLSIDISQPASDADTGARDRVRRALTQHGVKAPDVDSMSVVVESTHPQ